MNKKNDQLEGNANKRIEAHRPTNHEGTAAYADVEKKLKKSKVPIPSLDNVIEAKDWVDNGSKL